MEVYNYFDAIVCISLKYRKDRQEQVDQVFKDLGIQNRVSYHLADKSPLGGMYGCFESHINVIKKAYDDGLENVLIFEDDIYPTASYSPKMIQVGIDFMKKLPSSSWDIFYYGYFPVNERFKTVLLANPVTDHIVAFRPNATHAYCVNRSGMKKILSMYHSYIGKIHLDEYYSSLLPLNSFCIVPMLFEQHLCMPHDNQAFKLSHVVGRKFQCASERVRGMYIVSWITWFYHTLWWVCITSVLIMAVIIAFKQSMKKRS
jgi:GR25 family glycosyltransferase involved in LPS biosynthesis